MRAPKPSQGIAMTLNLTFVNPIPVPEKVEPEGKPEVSTYDFNGMSLRVVQIDGEPWFVAIDACRALGAYVKTSGAVNTAMALRHLNDDEIRDLPKTNPIGVRGGRCLKLISESGLYKLITRSDKPEAKPFQEWVTRDVLPSIRKTGSYSLTDGVEPARVVAGEITQNNTAEAVENEFKAMVSTRFNRRVQQIAALKAELHELEIA